MPVPFDPGTAHQDLPEDKNALAPASPPTVSRSGWSQLVVLGEDWEWRGARLWNKSAVPVEDPAQRSRLKSAFVSLVYADQNRSPIVRRTLESLMSTHAGGLVLNVGAGSTVLRGAVNIDLHDGANIDIVAVDERIPFRDASVDLVVLQEVLEHVAKPASLIAEIARVLRPGGHLYCQTPFQIGFHPGPCDYWRFSRQGLQELFSGPEWGILDLGISLGHGSGFYRIAVEFFAVTASCLWRRIYMPVKAAAAFGLYPLKWFDGVTARSSEADRIPGGYFCVVERTSVA
jgi:SAM-dependent methyltransferase